ncbi:MAG: DUF5615 family PIN-like protein [Burkholderiales bacterium]|jgi:predicted nuclease of predicted toxin-antitoxin system|uniref:DUF5615 domain-containing protein n=1 Tax=Candidatus Desulfobacillus denitrificans TaxID=2608985 RepID=A0A809R0E2_9PROT|nr:DUF5615 family PIN-like protein [Zoogloeaceae bacterium]MBV6409644.1 hypothetical protein [Rhodocyclaceae bacterium]MCZ2175226.1 DUF5615 family PIN-like protein [Burkholderiales bacterium]OQY68396.1 MAG: hypothetical protein B6D47_10290 [Rhodocyclaceae bacterium UTPRO2]BBO21110.1 conserved hypothetical protein [Candidatus Desulfobacillus denitrificans]GIK46989.1 MAG: hypothetical protein BroJett012_28920 [Betaproteobacteria bacterium]
MNLWVDAQLPPQLAHWIKERFGIEACALRDLGLRDATDERIFQSARREGIVIVSKDSDFVELSLKYGTPPQLIWITCGNVTNRHLKQVFSTALPTALDLIKSGEAIVEIG